MAESDGHRGTIREWRWFPLGATEAVGLTMNFLFLGCELVCEEEREKRTRGGVYHNTSKNKVYRRHYQMA